MPYELKDRQHGWMNAIGLLLKRVSPDVAKGINDVLETYGDNLRVEIENGGHDDAAANEGVNPCGVGQRS